VCVCLERCWKRRIPSSGLVSLCVENSASLTCAAQQQNTTQSGNQANAKVCTFLRSASLEAFVRPGTAGILGTWPRMASERSDDSPSSRPLLHDFDIDDSQQKGHSSISRQSLEDGDHFDFELEHLRRQSRSGFWRRLCMAVRQRRNGAAKKDLKGTSLDGEQHRRPQRWRKGKRVCVMGSVLSVIVL
jgi:hypothetical protein